MAGSTCGPPPPPHAMRETRARVRAKTGQQGALSRDIQYQYISVQQHISKVQYFAVRDGEIVPPHFNFQMRTVLNSAAVGTPLSLPHAPPPTKKQYFTLLRCYSGAAPRLYTMQRAPGYNCPQTKLRHYSI